MGTSTVALCGLANWDQNGVRSGTKFWFGGTILGWWQNFVLRVKFELGVTFCVRGDILSQGKILEKNKLEKT